MDPVILLAGIQAQNGTLRNARATYLWHDFGHFPARREDIVERAIRHRIYGDRLSELMELCGILPDHWDRHPSRL